MKTGKLIVFSAPSGSGKTTLVQHLLSQSLPLGFSISATSRAPRGKEQNGIDYHFMTPKEFQEKIQQDAFLEYEEVYQGLYYGTLLSELNRLWNQEKHILFDIDVIGGLNIKKKYPNNTLAIFVQPPSIKILEERLKKRATDSEETIQKRIQKAQMEIEYAPKFDTVLINKDLKTAKKEVVQVVRNFIES
ncbi:MAG: guanylate kinase [Flavobacteriaceae bacterium]|nr:guanylate kinase [Flavobacteriaceae bacterium]